MGSEKFKRGHDYPGFFFTFEGGEGSGKSTQIKQLAEYLEKQGKKVLVGREPGGTPVGEQIRHTLQYSKQSHAMVPEAELLLFAASRVQLVREVIGPALNEEKIVLLDRYFDSTTAYQGAGRQLRKEDVEAINRFAIWNMRPDLTFLLDLDPKVGLERTRGRELFDRMEQQSPDFFDRTRLEYLKLAKAEPHRFRVMDATKGIEDIQSTIRGYVDSFLRAYEK